MKTSSFRDLSIGVMVSGPSMSPHRSHTTPSSPTIPSPSRSEKLLRDALLRDERERRHRSSTPPLTEAPSHRRRRTLSPTSSYSASTKEDYACGSSLHTEMNVPPGSYKTDITPSRIPVHIQTHRKKERGLEMRMPTQDRHSSASTESYSTSGSSVSHFHISGYCASQSSFDAVSAPPHSPPHTPPHTPPHFSIVHHLGQQSEPNSPSPSTKHFNARKASTQCRAIEGYVSFASVEGLGEPPLVGEEFDADGRGNGTTEDERMRAVAFLPMGVLSAALRWKKFVGGAGHGISHGIESKDQGVVV